MVTIDYLDKYLLSFTRTLERDQPFDHYQALRNIYLMLKKTSTVCEISIATSACARCARCGELASPTDSIKLPCADVICTPQCLKELVNGCTNGDIRDYHFTMCPKEGVAVPREIVIIGFGGEEEFIQALNVANSANEPILMCGICCEDKRMGEFITFDCNHRFCCDCTKELLLNPINEGKVNEEILACPEDNIPININIILNLLNSDEKDKFDRFLLNTWEPSNEEKAVTYKCRGVNCDYLAIVPEDINSLTCPKCKVTVCPRCYENPHPDSKCVIGKEEADLPEGFFPCPWCGATIERAGGCKYMTCPSPLCQGMKYFCADCKEKLEGDHARHECVTKDLLRRRIADKCSIF